MRSETRLSQQFRYTAISIAGVRPLNEDAWCAAQAGGGLLCAVADGIGGQEAGDVASSLAIQVLRETVLNTELSASDPETAAETLRKGHALADEAIRDQATGRCSGMGTTLVSAFFGNRMVALCNTGDSRCTLIRNGIVLPLTKDHSFVQDLVDRGALTSEEAATHQMGHVITHSIGAEFVAECSLHPLLPDDTLVLSSDGLHDHVSREAMTAAGEAKSAEEAAGLLLREASRTSGDNITLIVVRVIR